MLLLKKIFGHTKMRDKKLFSVGKEVIKLQVNSLKQLQSHIGTSFEKIVKLILNCKNGKVITSGVGRKIKRL